VICDSTQSRWLRRAATAIRAVSDSAVVISAEASITSSAA
jgi:hypothetical protein